MDNRNFDFQHQNAEENKSSAKSFWKHVGFIALALFMAAVTVVVLNLNR